MLTSHCGNCGGPKEPADYANPTCGPCRTLRTEAEQGFAAEHPGASQGDILYAGRMAMQARAIHPGANYMDPRKFSGTNGMIPVPPQADRGNPNPS